MISTRGALADPTASCVRSRHDRPDCDGASCDRLDDAVRRSAGYGEARAGAFSSDRDSRRDLAAELLHDAERHGQAETRALDRAASS